MLKYNMTYASGRLSSVRLPGLISLIVSLKGCEVRSARKVCRGLGQRLGKLRIKTSGLILPRLA